MFGVALIPFPVLLLVGGAVWYYLWTRLVRARTDCAVSTLALLAGRNLPLVQGLRAIAKDASAATAPMLNRLADRLESGLPVSESLYAAHRSIPAEVLGTIQAGEASGTLPAVLRSLVLSRRPETEPPLWGSGLIYCILTAIVLLVQCLVFTIVLAPGFINILADYGLDALPPATQTLVHLTQPLSRVAVAVIAVLLLLAIVLLSPAARLLARRSPLRQGVFSILIDLAVWYLPIAGRLAQYGALGRQLNALAISISFGHDLPTSLSHAARVDANFIARERLRRWRKLVRQGTPADQAARQSRMPRNVVAAVSRAANSDALAAALASLGAHYASLEQHRRRLITGVATPVMALLLALATGFVVYAIFAPIQAILDHLIEEIG